MLQGNDDAPGWHTRDDMGFGPVVVGMRRAVYICSTVSECGCSCFRYHVASRNSVLPQVTACRLRYVGCGRVAERCNMHMPVHNPFDQFWSIGYQVDAQVADLLDTLMALGSHLDGLQIRLCRRKHDRESSGKYRTLMAMCHVSPVVVLSRVVTTMSTMPMRVLDVHTPCS